MDIIIAAIIALTLDLLLGDPEWLIHPVVIMGRYIKSAEKRLGKVFPKTARGEYAAGMVLAISLPVLTFSITYGIIYLAGRCSPAAAFVLQVFWGWQAIAVKGLISAGKDVAGALDKMEQQTNSKLGKEYNKVVYRHPACLIYMQIT